ncbi:MAG: hypothetical protein WA172_19585 [Terriglobales bacterium]
MGTLALGYVARGNKADLVSTEDLAQILHSFLSPSQSEQHISPNDPPLREIEDALEAPGTTIFLYGGHAPGDSLAQVLAAHRLPDDKAASDQPVPAPLVIDEFDEITSEAERTRFADFIKEIGNRHSPLHFVLCGVSESVRKLLGAHESCYSTDFAQPSPDARIEVIDSTTPGASHGLPHYVHLVSERLFWEMFNDPTFARSLI